MDSINKAFFSRIYAWTALSCEARCILFFSGTRLSIPMLVWDLLYATALFEGSLHTMQRGQMVRLPKLPKIPRTALLWRFRQCDQARLVLRKRLHVPVPTECEREVLWGRWLESKCLPSIMSQSWFIVSSVGNLSFSQRSSWSHTDTAVTTLKDHSVGENMPRRSGGGGEPSSWPSQLSSARLVYLHTERMLMSDNVSL